MRGPRVCWSALWSNKLPVMDLYSQVNYTTCSPQETSSGRFKILILGGFVSLPLPSSLMDSDFLFFIFFEKRTWTVLLYLISSQWIVFLFINLRVRLRCLLLYNIVELGAFFLAGQIIPGSTNHVPETWMNYMCIHKWRRANFSHQWSDEQATHSTIFSLLVVAIQSLCLESYFVRPFAHDFRVAFVVLRLYERKKKHPMPFRFHGLIV